MKKPTEAIERMRRVWGDDLKEVLAYLDSIPEWPADLTRERLEELADSFDEDGRGAVEKRRSDALSRLAAIAPKRGKRKGYLYERDDPILKKVRVWDEVDHAQLEPGWRKVGEAEIDA